MKLSILVAMFAASASLACARTKHGQSSSVQPASQAERAATTAAVVAGRPRSDLIPRAVLFGDPERTNLTISPDGKYLAWLAPFAGTMTVWTMKTGGELAHARPVTRDSQRPVFYYMWTYDGKHLLYVHDRKGDENFHLYRTDVRAGKTIDLTPYDGVAVTPIAPSPHKPGVVLATINDRDPKVLDLVQIEIETGKRKLIFRNDRGLSRYIVDRDLNLRFAVRYEADGSATYFAYDRYKKTLQEYDRVGAEDAMTTDVVGFDRRGTSYYLLDARGHNTRGLYRVDVKTRKRSLIFRSPRADAPDHSWQTRGSLLVHPRDFDVDALLVEYERPHWVTLDPRFERDLTGVAKLGEGVPSIESRTLADDKWIVQLKNDATPSRYYLWDRAKQRGRLVFSAQPALDAQPLVPMQPVILRSRDGLPLVSYLSIPRGVDASADGRVDRPIPMVLLVHGGPWGRDRWGFNPQHQLLANRGYATLSVNFRGSTGFGKVFANAGIREWGKKMQDDLHDAVAWAVDSGVTTADKVCIMGASYGGYATLAGLSMTPDKFACGVDMVGPSNIVTLIKAFPPYWRAELGVWHHRVGNPNTAEGRRALLAVSPLTHATKIARPLLIGQGANDPRVTKAESEQIVQALSAKQIPVSYVVFPDEGHNFMRPENRIAFYAVTEAFLSVHLGGNYEPISERELSASSLSIEHGRESLPGLPAERVAGSAR